MNEEAPFYPSLPPMNNRTGCHPFKTRKKYLCNKSERGLRGNWCKINPHHVLKFSEYLGTPSTHNNYYWDYISETEPNGFGYETTNGNLVYSVCDTQSNKNYTLSRFGCLMMALLSKPLIGRVQQTLAFANMSDKDILLQLFEKLKELLPDDDTRSVVEETLKSIKNDIMKLEENNPEAMGKYLKEVLKQSKKMIEANTSSKYKGIATPVIDFFIKEIPDDVAFEVLKGANFKIKDKGALYNYATTKLDGYGRFSSHQSDKTQIGSTDVFVDTYFHLLCGESTENGDTFSWCQFEGAPMPPGLNTYEVVSNIINGGENREKYLKYYVDHFADSAVYFSLSKTIQLVGGKGFNLAIGKSIHTDTNRLEFPLLGSEYEIEYEQEQDIDYEQQTLSFERASNNFTYALGQSDMNSLFRPEDHLYGTKGTLRPTTNHSLAPGAPAAHLAPVAPAAYLAPAAHLALTGGKNKKTRKRKRKRSFCTNRFTR